MEDFSSVAAWAEMNKLGCYNNVLGLMEKDRMIPGYESKTFDLYKGVGRDYGYSAELSIILDAFVEANGAQEILL
jgi:hypothetical protein